MIATILIAAGGSLAVNVLSFLEALNLPKDRRPDFSDWAYWIPYLIYPVLGGFVAYVYTESGFDLKAVLALQVGASAPLILRAAANAAPHQLNIGTPPPGA